MFVECNSLTHVPIALIAIQNAQRLTPLSFSFVLSKDTLYCSNLVAEIFCSILIALNKVQEMTRMYLTNWRHLTFRNPDSFYFRCNGKWHQISKILWKWISFQPCSVFGPLLGKLIVDGSWYDCRFFNVSFFIIRGNKEHCWGVI